jgi:DNA-binding MarR family transcriptional regulator
MLQRTSTAMSIKYAVYTSDCTTEARRLPTNLLFTANWLNNRIREFLAPYDITRKQYDILRVLRDQSPDSMPIQNVRMCLTDKMSDASRLIDRLVKKGLVKKKTCSQDRRSNRALITDAGLELLDQIDREAGDIDEISTSLTKEEIKQLNVLLDKLRG